MPHLAARANRALEKKFSLGCGWVERSRSCVSLLLRLLSSSPDISQTLHKVWIWGCLVLRWRDSKEGGCWWETTPMRLKDQSTLQTLFTSKGVPFLLGLVELREGLSESGDWSPMPRGPGAPGPFSPAPYGPPHSRLRPKAAQAPERYYQPRLRRVRWIGIVFLLFSL